MVKEVLDSEYIVVPPEKVLQGASELSYDQVAVIGMKNGKFEVFSSHSAVEMDNMIDDALDALEAGDIGESQ